MNIKQLKIIALMALFVMSALVITPLAINQNASGQTPSYMTPQYIYTVALNSLWVVPESANWTSPITINLAYITGYNQNGSNTGFSLGFNGASPLYAWVESYSTKYINYYVNINVSTSGKLVIYYNVYSTSVNFYNASVDPNPYTGEAPNLSPVYGEYDNGFMVFQTMYDNFANSTDFNKYFTSSYSTALSFNNGLNYYLNWAGYDYIVSNNAYIPYDYGLLIGFTNNSMTNLGGGSIDLGYSNSNNQAYFFANSTDMWFSTYSTNDFFYMNTTGYSSYTQFESIQPPNVTLFAEVNNAYDSAFSVNTASSPLQIPQSPSTLNNPNTLYLLSSQVDTSGLSDYILIYLTQPAANYIGLSISYIALVPIIIDINNNGIPNEVYPESVPSYTTTFNEIGLPSGTEWNVTINNNVYSTNTTSLNISLYNGTYSYEAQSSNSTFLPDYGNITINNANTVVNLTFTSLPYNVEFNESGLPSSTLWNMTLNNSIYNFNNSTNTNSLNFSVPDGTYSYTALANNFYNPIYGNITVNGANITDSILFTNANTYNVEFIESGLPSGTEWNTTVNTSMGNFTNSTNTASMNFTLPNGTYNYNEFTSVSYYSNMSGNFTVNGANTTVYLNYSIYNVTFLESGLPNGTEWNIYLNTSTVNLIEESTNTTSLSYYLENGNYTYLMTQNNSQVFLSEYYDNINGLFVIQNGNFTVNNSNMTIYLNFTLYAVNFNIINPYPYFIQLNNTTYSTLNSYNSSFIEYMPNGTYYDYIEIGNSNYPFAVTSGLISPFDVNGLNWTFNITFSTYDLEFNITGLPSGDSLYIIVYDNTNGTPMFNITTTSQYVYALLPSGSYYYEMSVSDNNYTAFGNPYSTNNNPYGIEAFPMVFTISNNLIIINVSIYYNVLTIEESGLNIDTGYVFNLTYTSNGTVISSVSLNSQYATEYIWKNLPIDVNLTVIAWAWGSNTNLTDSFYFTGNYTYDFNFIDTITEGGGNITVNVYEVGLPLNTLWYFNLVWVTGNVSFYNESSYYSFITFFNITSGIYSYTAYSQGYGVITNPQYNLVNNTTITVNFISNSITIGNNTNFNNPYNSTNNFNFNLSQWETITFLGGSSVVMAVVGAFVNPIGAFIVFGIEMLIGYELSIVDAWILFFVGLAITALIFYSRDSSKIEE